MGQLIHQQSPMVLQSKHFKILVVLLLGILNYSHTSAQSNDILAKSYFLKAQQAYSEGNNIPALDNLDKCLNYLDSTNARIEALYVKIALNQRDYISADQHLTTYFELAGEERSDYMEMLGYVVDVKERKASRLEQLKFQEGLAPIKIKGKWGYYNRNNELVIDAKYDEVKDFSDGKALVKLDNSFGIISNQGTELTAIKYDEILPLNEKGYRRTKASDKVGILNDSEIEILPPEFNEITFNYDKGFIIVKRDGKMGLFQLDGSAKIPCEYDKIDFVENFDNLVKVSKKVKLGNDTYPNIYWGVLSLVDGKAILPVKYYDINIGSKNLWVLRSGGNAAAYNFNSENLNGKFLTDFKYEFLFSVTKVTENADVLEYHLRNGEKGLLDLKTGKHIEIKEEYAGIGTFKDGLAPIEENDMYLEGTERYGFINKKGEIVIPIKYRDFDSDLFYDKGIIKVKKRKSWIRLDRNGNKVN
ncbi:MAG: WG repeat-containing protein [Nonlabens sp.]